MGTFLLFVCAVIGMTHIIVDGAIFQPVREWVEKNTHEKFYDLFQCYQCMGFWCGMFCGFIVVSFNIFTVLACGFAGSFLASFGAYFLEYLQTLIMIEIPDREDK